MHHILKSHFSTLLISSCISGNQSQNKLQGGPVIKPTQIFKASYIPGNAFIPHSSIHFKKKKKKFLRTINFFGARFMSLHIVLINLIISNMNHQESRSSITLLSV